MWAKAWAGTEIYWCGKFSDSSYSKQEKDRELGTGEQPLVYIPLEEKGLVQRCLTRWWQPLMTPSSQPQICCTPGWTPWTPPAPSSLTDPSHSAHLAQHLTAPAATLVACWGEQGPPVYKYTCRSFSWFLILIMWISSIGLDNQK